jgi:hypothetical protein
MDSSPVGPRMGRAVRTLLETEGRPVMTQPRGAPPGHLRASHADRERLIAQLEAAFAAGVLTKDAFDRGVNLALASRTHADLAAAAAVRPGQRPGPGQAAAWGVCGLVLTAFLTVVIIPSGTTMGVVALTAAVVYGIFCVLAGTMTLASRHVRVSPGPGRRRRGPALQCLVRPRGG